MLLNLRVEQVDIAAAHGDDQIAGLPMRAQIGLRVVEGRGIMRGNALLLHGLHEHGRVDIAGVFFARGEDIRHQHVVGQIAAVDVILKQRFDAGIGVRLHDGEQALVRLLHGVFQRAAHFGGVMASYFV